MKPIDDACALCGLPLRYGRFPLSPKELQPAFCCQGCRQVYIMLSEASEFADPAAFRQTDLYHRCVAMGVIPRSEADLAMAVKPDPVDGRSEDADDQDNATDRGRGLALHLAIEGMWCPACAWVIEETLRKQPGIHSAGCNFSTDRLRCTYDPTAISPTAIEALIQRLGYRACELASQSIGRQKRRFFVRFAVSAFLTMNVMMLSFALYAGFFTDLDAASIWKISWPMFFLATGVMFYGGLPLHRRGLAGILGGRPGMESLISIGAASAYGYSIFNLLKGSIHLYFDTTCMLILLVQLGKMLERQAKDRIQEDLGHYYALIPTKVYLCAQGQSRGRYVAAGQLAPGDHFRVTEGETLAADGLVVEGAGLVDAASLTGEARPLPKRRGDRLASGMRITEGTFRIRAEKVAEASTLGQMLGIMDAALNRKTPVEDLTDRVLRLFVPIVVGLALATILVVLLRGAPFEDAFIRGLTVLVISCPCALGLAVPLARVAGISLAARQGMLVQDVTAFDKATQIDTVVFDKTGTLTRGRWQLQTIEASGSLDGDKLLALAAGLEQGVDHPVAFAIGQAAVARGIEAEPMTSRDVLAWGVVGNWQGCSVRVGLPKRRATKRLRAIKRLCHGLSWPSTVVWRDDWDSVTG